MKGPPIVGPLTNQPCQWYRYNFEKRESRIDTFGKNSTDWRIVSFGVGDALFELRDATGCCVIDPDGAEVIPDASDVSYGKTATGRNMLSVAMGRYRFTEERLSPGHILVMGTFQTLNNAEPSLTQAVGTLLRDGKEDQAALLSRFDRNTDGEIDLAEWEEVRKVAEQKVFWKQAACASDPVTHTLVKPASDRHPFIISATAQASLIPRYRRVSFMAFGSMSLTGAGLLWVIASRLG